VNPRFFGLIVGAALGAAAALWSCTVERPSQSLKCLGHTDCQPGRICEGGYCIVGMLPPDARELDAAVCPDTCNGGCDFTTTTCTITGTGTANITCPTAWNCNIGCSTPGACGMIDCINAASCDIACTSDNACLGITCGTGKCTVACQGIEPSCGPVSCADSCQCDVTCNGTTDTCPTTMSCPDPPGGTICWIQATGRCDSSVSINQCRKCT
jgi:hypothetical protein